MSDDFGGEVDLEPAGLAPEDPVIVLDLHVVLQTGGPFETLGAVGTLLRECPCGALFLRVSVEMLGALVEL